MPHGNKTPDDSEDSGPCFRADWDFDGVPNDELVACCLWEYARESATINMVADLAWCHARRFSYRDEYQRDPALKISDDERAKRIELRAESAAFDYEAFSTKFWRTDYPLIEFYSLLTQHVGEGALSWTELSSEARASLTKRVTKSHLPPLQLAMVGELEQLWQAHRTELEEVRANIKSDDDDSEIGALYTLTEPLHLPEEEKGEPSKIVAAAFAIDFSRYNDQEIIVGFQNWLAAHRPVRWKKPARVFPKARAKGRKLLEYKVALERLGLMRLLHWHTPAELQRDRPEAWNRYRRKEHSFRREVRAVRDFFRAVFPFLPENEVPASDVRKNVWLSKMMTIMDELDDQMCASGQ